MIEIVLTMLRARLDEPPHELDEFLRSVIFGVMSDLEAVGIHLQDSDAGDILFVTDMSAWKYSCRDKAEGMPEWLRLARRERYLREVRDAAE